MRRWISITTFVAAAAVAIAPATGSAKTNRVRAVSCTLELFAQGAPTPAGVHLGLTSCSRPFGSGLHYNSYTVTPTTPGNRTVVATFKNYYDRETTRGSATLTFAATSPTDITYIGTITYRGATGKFKRVAGSGTIRCTSIDGGVHKTCVVKSTLSGI